MRQRVLTYLKGLSIGDPALLKEAAQFLDGPPADIQGESRAILERIFENYSDFQVRTIDSFMSTVFRASSLEFGFHPDFEILLTKDSLIDEAFDLLAREMKDNDIVLLERLVNLVTQTRGGDSSYLWDPFTRIVQEVKRLYALLASQPKNELVQDLTSERITIENAIVAQASRLQSFVNESGLQGSKYLLDDLACAKERDFGKLVERTLKREAVNKPKGKREQQALQEWGGRIQEALKIFNDHIGAYILCLSRSFYNPYLQAIGMIRSPLSKLKRQRGTIFIDDVNKMLVKVLNQQAVPDVYLALGDTIYHYLIDEFQDTSPIQWAALKPLIENSVSLGGSVFVVGDMKQSIYRFRGADWTIMRRMTELKEFPSAGYEQIPLDTNWRSYQRIIQFTERVFGNAARTQEYEAAAAVTGLSHLSHRVKEEHLGKGYVEVVRVSRETEEPGEKAPILALAEECHHRGYLWRDIAILTRENDGVVEISRWLHEQGIPFISHSNLDIRTRKVVGELIALLRFLDSPVDDLSFFTVVTGNLFTQLLLRRGEKPVRESMQEHTAQRAKSRGTRDPLYKIFQTFHPAIWDWYLDPLYRQVGYLPLYDLLSQIYAAFTPFDIFPEEEAALSKLLEVVRTFEEEGHNSIKDFVLSAADSVDDATWQMDAPAGMDAVSLMTVHKAKGLERAVVIVVLYERRKSRSEYHVEYEEDGIRVLKITEKMASKVDVLRTLYEFESLKERADDLNQLYVALTRAKEEMYVVGVHGERLQEPVAFLPQEGYEPKNKPAVLSRVPVLGRTVDAYHLTAPLSVTVAGGPEGLNVYEKKRGDLVHAILREIEYAEEPLRQLIDEAAQRVLTREDEPFPVEQIARTIEEFLRNGGVIDAFRRKPGRRILREQELCDANGRLFRADRIILDGENATVIDFKTGGDEREEEYVQQLKDYMELVAETYRARMVRGVLAYVDRQHIRTLE
jgi:ATP-dependent helicase/nuclease subunit A